MGKLKVADGKKAQPHPFSLLPKHILMLDEISKYKRKNKSKIIQSLIKKEYDNIIKTISEEGGLNESA